MTHRPKVYRGRMSGSNAPTRIQYLIHFLCSSSTRVYESLWANPIGKMASKSLLRNGAALLNRLSLSNSKSLINYNNPQPYLFPSISKLQNFPQDDAESVKKLLCSDGFLYPCGLPSLRFFLPDGTFSVLHLFVEKMGFFFIGYKVLIFGVLDEKNGYFLLGIKFRFLWCLMKKNGCFFLLGIEFWFWGGWWENVSEDDMHEL